MQFAAFWLWIAFGFFAPPVALAAWYFWIGIQGWSRATQWVLLLLPAALLFPQQEYALGLVCLAVGFLAWALSGWKKQCSNELPPGSAWHFSLAEFTAGSFALALAIALSVKAWPLADSLGQRMAAALSIGAAGLVAVAAVRITEIVRLVRVSRAAVVWLAVATVLGGGLLLPATRAFQRLCGWTDTHSGTLPASYFLLAHPFWMLLLPCGAILGNVYLRAQPSVKALRDLKFLTGFMALASGVGLAGVYWATLPRPVFPPAYSAQEQRDWQRLVALAEESQVFVRQPGFGGTSFLTPEERLAALSQRAHAALEQPGRVCVSRQFADNPRYRAIAERELEVVRNLAEQLVQSSLPADRDLGLDPQMEWVDDASFARLLDGLQIARWLQQGGTAEHTLNGIWAQKHALQQIDWHLNADENQVWITPQHYDALRDRLAELTPVTPELPALALAQRAQHESKRLWEARFLLTAQKVCGVGRSDDGEHSARKLAALNHDRLLAESTCHVAIRRFFFTEDRLPASLDELAPNYLPAIPADPLTAQPLTYELKSGRPGFRFQEAYRLEWR